MSITGQVRGSSVTLVVDSRADLDSVVVAKHASHGHDTVSVDVLGYSAAHDGGGGTYDLLPASPLGGAAVANTLYDRFGYDYIDGSGRFWKKNGDVIVTPEDMGAFDRTLDDTDQVVALDRMVEFATSLDAVKFEGKKFYFPPQSEYRIESTLYCNKLLAEWVMDGVVWVPDTPARFPAITVVGRNRDATSDRHYSDQRQKYSAVREAPDYSDYADQLPTAYGAPGVSPTGAYAEFTPALRTQFLKEQDVAVEYIGGGWGDTIETGLTEDFVVGVAIRSDAEVPNSVPIQGTVFNIGRMRNHKVDVMMATYNANGQARWCADNYVYHGVKNGFGAEKPPNQTMYGIMVIADSDGVDDVRPPSGNIFRETSRDQMKNFSSSVPGVGILVNGGRSNHFGEIKFEDNEGVGAIPYINLPHEKADNLTSGNTSAWRITTVVGKGLNTAGFNRNKIVSTTSNDILGFYETRRNLHLVDNLDVSKDLYASGSGRAYLRSHWHFRDMASPFPFAPTKYINAPVTYLADGSPEVVTVPVDFSVGMMIKINLMYENNRLDMDAGEDGFMPVIVAFDDTFGSVPTGNRVSNTDPGDRWAISGVFTAGAVGGNRFRYGVDVGRYTWQILPYRTDIKYIYIGARQRNGALNELRRLRVYLEGFDYEIYDPFGGAYSNNDIMDVVPPAPGNEWKPGQVISLESGVTWVRDATGWSPG